MISYFMIYLTLSQIGNDLNPLNWGKDISSAFVSKLESGLLYLFTKFVDAVLSLFSGILGSIMSAVNYMIGGIVDMVSYLGPFSLPMFFILLLIIFFTLYIIITMIKDVPVVGDFA